MTRIPSCSFHGYTVVNGALNSWPFPYPRNKLPSWVLLKCSGQQGLDPWCDSVDIERQRLCCCGLCYNHNSWLFV